jgi:hypothetical protein
MMNGETEGREGEPGGQFKQLSINYTDGFEGNRKKFLSPDRDSNQVPSDKKFEWLLHFPLIYILKEGIF